MIHKILGIIIILVILSGCNVTSEDPTETIQTSEAAEIPTPSSIATTALSTTEITAAIQKSETIEELAYILSNLSYSVNTEMFEDIDKEREIDITIKYPQISGMEDEKKQKRINELIKESAMGPYHYYQHRKLNLTEPETFNNTSWPVEYTIAYATGDILSVRFEGYIYAKGSAHGTNWVYAVNINMNTGERITIDELFTKLFREKLSHENFKGVEVDTTDADPGAMKELFERFEENFIDSHNNFYFGVEKFYIILPIDNFFTFEASYDDLKDCINWDNPIWSEILEVR